MPDNLESFVKKLQEEGVDAGRTAAEKLKKEAEQEAEAIISHAHEEAEAIVRQAEEEADKTFANTEANLKMAVRDAVLGLRDALGRALTGVMAHRVEEALGDPDYLKAVVREVVLAYAKRDASGEDEIAMDVSEDLPKDWVDSLLRDLAGQLEGAQDRIKVRAGLVRAGFDYRIKDATVEVSPDSVTEMLMEMVTPRLQKVISRSVGDAPGGNSKGAGNGQ